MKVAIVENDVSYARFLAIVAEHCGCEVLVYHTGQQALGDALTPDVVLLSLSLPDMDALEFIRKFRQRRRSTSIIAVSGDMIAAESARAFNVDVGLIHPLHQAGVECIMQRLAIAADRQVFVPTMSAMSDSEAASCY
jgi:CheY-like chemotaxis protein